MLHLTTQEKKALEAFKKEVTRRFANQIILFKLFGSRARGEGNEESDLDVLVLLKEVTSQVKNQILDIAADIFLEFEIDISPLVMSQKHFKDMQKRERLLPEEIERDGQSL